jgi:hypothetical protein
MQTVSESVIESRVRRALCREGEVLRKTRPGTPEATEFGAYWTADPHTGSRERWHLDLGELARELRVLHPHEVIEE